MATFDDALAAYRICAQAEGKSPKTVRWIMSSITYFKDFLGPDGQDIESITGNDLRRFIIELQQRPDVPPKNCTSYDVRKTETVKRGDLDGKERLHTGTDHK